MHQFYRSGFLKTEKVPKWAKVTPLVVTMAIGVSMHAEANTSEGGERGTVSASGVPGVSTAAGSPRINSRIAQPTMEPGSSQVVMSKVKDGDGVVEGAVSESVGRDSDNMQAAEPSVLTPVWESLEALEQSDKENALISLETGSTSSTNLAEEMGEATSLWNSGEYAQAIDAIRTLEESGNDLSVGISWKTPKTVTSANWANTDSQIGSRSDVYETHLDFDIQNGNQFAVLKYRDGSTTGWYWSANISTDKGKTWQETYTWFATYEIKDIGAAVVDDYLWVGYVGSTSFDEARLRRFNVSDGSVDGTFGYKIVFDKDRPIKEISVFTNADDFDNRVFYSAILEDYSTVLDTLVVTSSKKITRASAVDSVKVDAPPISGTNSEMLSQMSTNGKLNDPDAILENFNSGQEMTRVIVNLVNPAGGSATTNAVHDDFSDLSVRSAMSQDISIAQNAVLNALDQNQVRVTNTFTYIFGFSAEVSVEGLASLVNNPDVVSVEPDRIVEAHLAQGIPLMNATSARASYNGSGMAIAICDTGIDYTHSMLGGGSFPNSKVIGGYDTGQNDSNPMDGNGHGTSCAGIAAGTLGTSGDYIGGVANNAKLYALKMTYDSTGGSAYTSDMVEAWEWAVTHQNDDSSNPIRIISTSFGGGYYTSESTCDAASSAMATAAANAKAAGITIFASTGNDGYCDGTGWPGCMSDVVGVGAVYDADIGEPGWCVNANSCAPKSAHGGCSTGWAAFETSTAADQVTLYSNSASFMELFAPSNDAYTTAIGGGYTSNFGGTSAACPYAAGAAAVLQSANYAKTGSYLTPDQVQAALIDTGDAVTDGKVAITKPRVNVGNALNSVENLLFYWGYNVDTTSPTWVEIRTGIGNAMQGLDATYKNNVQSGDTWWSYLSYIATSGSNNPVMVARADVSDTWEIIQVLSDYTGVGGTTSLTAYGDYVNIAYEHQYTSDIGVRYTISYDAGDNWVYGTIQPGTGHGFFMPDVTARGGKGVAIVYSDEAGAFDPVWFQRRSGYTYVPWSTAEQVNEHDTLTGSQNSIQWLAPSSSSYYYGAIYLDSSRNAYFDSFEGKQGNPFLLYLPAILNVSHN